MQQTRIERKRDMGVNNMEEWEQEVDSINWKSMLKEIDEALLDNLAVEIGFRTFAQLEEVSELVVDDYYICHLSDGRWVWWNPKEYTTKDPKFFSNVEEAKQFISDFLQLDQEKLRQLEEGLAQVRQTKKCHYCEYEFDQEDQKQKNFQLAQQGFCSEECAVEMQKARMKEEVNW